MEAAHARQHIEAVPAQARYVLDGAAAAARTPAGLAFRHRLLAADVVALAAATLLAALSGGGLAAGWLVLFPLLVLAQLVLRGAYEERLRLQLPDDVRQAVTTASVAGMAVVSGEALFADVPGAVGEVVRLWLLAVLGVSAARALMLAGERRDRSRGSGAEPTLVIGAGSVGRLTARRLLERPEFGLRPVGFLAGGRSYEQPLPTLGRPRDLDRVVHRHGVRHAVLTCDGAADEGLLALARRCEQLGVTVSLVPPLYETLTERLRAEHLGGLMLVSAQRTHPRGWWFALKHGCDRVASAVLLVVLSPLLGMIAVAVSLSLGRPVFFRQIRVGRDGSTFEMLKFRSMRPCGPGADTGPQPLHPGLAPGGVDGADRRTRLGAFLRRSSFDELPQLVNVLRGEMSLVGPRPERPEFVEVFERTVPRYAERHRVKPGITGWAQVYGLRGKTSLADRAEWDNAYIESWSPWLDLKILTMTAAAVAGGRSVE